MARTWIYNGTIVQKDRVLEQASLLMDGNHIAEIREDNGGWDQDPFAEKIDAQGAYVVPGFMDLHSDHIEKVAQPRPQSLIDFDIAIREQEKQLVCQGITSMYHSLTMNGGSKTSKDLKALLRTPENYNKLVQLIRKHNSGDHIIRHRFHCRYDVTNTQGFDQLLEYIRNNDMQLLSFVDHTPGQGQYKDLEFFKNHVMGSDKTEEEKEEILRKRMNTARITAQQMEMAANLADQLGIPIASHDDDSLEKLDYVMKHLHIRICEFPITMEVAKEAHQRGLKVVVGANNVLMGRSHSNNLSALEAIREGCADILVSDYFPASLLHAVFKIYDMGLTTLPDAINMVTYNPACAVGVADHLGSLEVGKWADLLLIHRSQSMPVLGTAFVDGDKVMDIRYREKTGERYAG